MQEIKKNLNRLSMTLRFVARSTLLTSMILFCGCLGLRKMTVPEACIATPAKKTLLTTDECFATFVAIGNATNACIK